MIQQKAYLLMAFWVMSRPQLMKGLGADGDKPFPEQKQAHVSYTSVKRFT